MTGSCQLQSEAWGSPTSPARGRLPHAFITFFQAESDSGAAGEVGSASLGTVGSPLLYGWVLTWYLVTPIVSAVSSQLCFLYPEFHSEVLRRDPAGGFDSYSCQIQSKVKRRPHPSTYVYVYVCIYNIYVPI